MRSKVLTARTVHAAGDACRRYIPFVRIHVLMPFVLISALAALLSVAQQHAALSAPQAVDADTLVHQMVTAYQRAQAFSETSQCKIFGQDGKEYFQTCKIKYKRPNLLYVETHDPVQGTYIGVCNGHTVLFYSGSQNIFTQRTAPTKVALAVAEVSKASVSLIGTPQNQILNPLSFLNGKDRIVEAKDYVFVRMETVDGHSVAHIKARPDSEWLASMAPGYLNVTFLKSAISLWIDPDSKLLVQAACDLQWTSKQNGHTVPGSIRFVEIHRNVKINTLLRDEEDFNYSPPKGAVEKFR